MEKKTKEDDILLLRMQMVKLLDDKATNYQGRLSSEPIRLQARTSTAVCTYCQMLRINSYCTHFWVLCPLVICAFDNKYGMY